MTGRRGSYNASRNWNEGDERILATRSSAIMTSPTIRARMAVVATSVALRCPADPTMPPGMKTGAENATTIRTTKAESATTPTIKVWPCKPSFILFLPSCLIFFSHRTSGVPRSLERSTPPPGPAGSQTWFQAAQRWPVEQRTFAGHQQLPLPPLLNCLTTTFLKLIHSLPPVGFKNLLTNR